MGDAPKAHESWYKQLQKGEVQKILDGGFSQIQDAVGDTIGHFVAFFFFILAIGAFIGIIVIQKYPDQALMAVILPALAGALAFYNRAFATAIFAILIFGIFLL